MKMKTLTVAALAAAVTLGIMAVGSTPAEAQGKQFIAIGTGGPTGVYFVVGQSVCRLVHKEAAEGRFFITITKIISNNKFNSDFIIFKTIRTPTIKPQIFINFIPFK